MTPDGRHVLFHSSAADLVANANHPGPLNLFLRDLSSASTVLASVTADGAPMSSPFNFFPMAEFGNCSAAALSTDGRYAVFAANGGNAGNVLDIYRYDRTSGTTLHISTAGNGFTPQVFNDCPSVSADGNRVAFHSIGTQNTGDIFLRDIAASSLTRPLTLTTTLPVPVSIFSRLLLNADGSSLMFSTSYLPLAEGHSHVFRINSSAAPERLTQPLPAVAPYANDHSGDSMGMGLNERAASLSADGRYVVFTSLASNLVANDSNGVADVFLRDRFSGTTQRISRRSDASESNCASRHASISADSRFVVFSSCGYLAAPASGGRSEVYRYDRMNATLELVSRNHAGQRANGASTDPHVSADGNIVVFGSGATDLLATSGSGWQIFARDMTAGNTALVSATPDGQPASGYSFRPYVSADGSTVAFTSSDSDLTTGDTNNRADAFVTARVNPLAERVSRAANGDPGSGGGEAFGLGADGNLALFTSSYAGVHPQASAYYSHVFLRDRGGNTTHLLGVPGDDNHQGRSPSLSADGTKVAFISNYRSLLGSYDNIDANRVYLLDRPTGQYRAITPFLTPDQGNTTLPQLSADGHTIAFNSSRGTLAMDGNGPIFDVFAMTDLADALFADGFEQ